MSVGCQETIKVGDPVLVSVPERDNWLEARAEVLRIFDGGHKILVRLHLVARQVGEEYRAGDEIIVGSREVEPYTGDWDRHA